MGIKIYTKLDLQNSAVNLSQYSTVPTNPKIGDMVVIAGVVHFYTSIDGSEPFWMPIAQSRSSYKHVQQIPSTTWLCTHNLSTTDILCQVYDDAGDIVYATPTFLSVDQIQIQFTEPTAGYAVIFGTSSKFAGFSPNAESLTSDTVTYGTTEPGDLSTGSIYFQV